MALHNHILLNGHVSNPPKDIEATKEWLRQLVKDIDMKLIQGPYASYVDAPGNRGLTATVMIETSHIALHVWDEDSPALIQFDLYTCSTLPVMKVIDSVNKFMGLLDYRYMVMERRDGFNVVSTETIGA
jgi:S-adenosylmethionine/arginine decarboxylase-like enzyme